MITDVLLLELLGLEFGVWDALLGVVRISWTGVGPVDAML
tara:strand:- start:19178 stop:19297 length:120 start_codon:yes stop_codon:yes gene_type:complete